MKKEMRKIGVERSKWEGREKGGEENPAKLKEGRTEGKKQRKRKEKRGRQNEEKELGKMEKTWGAECVAEWLNESGFRENRIISRSLEKCEGNMGGKVTAGQGADPGI